MIDVRDEEKLSKLLAELVLVQAEFVQSVQFRLIFRLVSIMTRFLMLVVTAIAV